MCWNTEAKITLTNAKYFAEKAKNISIRIMITFITVRSLEAQRHTTNKYVISFIFLSETNSEKRRVRVMIIKEIHLIDNFKFNLLIDSDILKSEKIDIVAFIDTAYIENCDVIVSIRIYAKFSFQIRSVHIIKSIVISSRSKMSVSIYTISISNKDYIFESDQTNFAIYTHVIDAQIKIILMRNDNKSVIRISRNFRLKKVIEINYLSAYLIKSTSNIAEFALKRSKLNHKFSWYQKVFIVCLTNHIESEKKSVISINKIFFNDVTIFNSFSTAVEVFIKVILKHFNFWANQSFVQLSKSSWMNISLKFDWETKIKDKVKMYSIDFKDRNLIDITFNKLHEKNKLAWIENFTLFNFSYFIVWRNFIEQRKKKKTYAVSTQWRCQTHILCRCNRTS